jgi:hypothetical protein
MKDADLYMERILKENVLLDNSIINEVFKNKDHILSYIFNDKIIQFNRKPS